MNFDRFSQEIPDVQEAQSFGQCEGCGGEIYSPEEFFEQCNGGLVHRELACVIIAEGLSDPAPFGSTCGGCGQDLHEGDIVVWLNSDIFHARLECLQEFLGFSEAQEEA